MKYILIFAFALSFASCGTNEPSNKGKLTNLAVSDGKAQFKLNEVQYTNVALLPSTAQTLQNLAGQDVEVVMSNGEITSVYTKSDNPIFFKYAVRFFGGCLILIMVIIGIGFGANNGIGSMYRGGGTNNGWNAGQRF